MITAALRFIGRQAHEGAFEVQEPDQLDVEKISVFFSRVEMRYCGSEQKDPTKILFPWDIFPMASSRWSASFDTFVLRLRS